MLARLPEIYEMDGYTPNEQIRFENNGEGVHVYN